LLNLSIEGTKVILMGAEKTGKTALCRMLYKHFYKNNFIPVLIEGHDIKASSGDDLIKLIKKNYSNQYSKDKLGEFEQLANSEKVLIVDDFDKARLNIKHKSLLLSNASKYFKNIIITTNDLFPVEEIMYEETEGDVHIGDYRQFKLMEFGYQLRNELVNKWNMLGQEHYLDNEQLIRKNDHAEKIMDSIIGYNYVPSVPIFLLIILHAIEVGQPHNLKESSYGRYYEYLITQTLTNLKIVREDLEAYYNYITELAFQLFIKKAREISNHDLNDFHDKLCIEYKIKLNFQEITDNLIKASILFDNKDWSSPIFTDTKLS
jgi:hypothetical protein